MSGRRRLKRTIVLIAKRVPRAGMRGEEAMLALRGSWGRPVAYDEHLHLWVWQPSEDKILRQFATARKSTRQAAVRIQCSFNAARQRARALGVRFRPKIICTNGWTQREDDEIRRGIAAGENPWDVAQRIDRGQAATRCRAKRLGLKFPPIKPEDPWTDDCLQRAKAWWLGGISGGVIAKRLGPPFTRSSVIAKMHRRHWLRENKTHPHATRKELRRRRNKARRAKRLKIHQPQPVHPLQRLVRWMGPPRAPTHVEAHADDVARITHEQLHGKH